jgi:hypothetical protein
MVESKVDTGDTEHAHYRARLSTSHTSLSGGQFYSIAPYLLFSVVRVAMPKQTFDK